MLAGKKIHIMSSVVVAFVIIALVYYIARVLGHQAINVEKEHIPIVVKEFMFNFDLTNIDDEELLLTYSGGPNDHSPSTTLPFMDTIVLGVDELPIDTNLDPYCWNRLALNEELVTAYDYARYSNPKVYFSIENGKIQSFLSLKSVQYGPNRGSFVWAKCFDELESLGFDHYELSESRVQSSIPVYQILFEKTQNGLRFANRYKFYLIRDSAYLDHYGASFENIQKVGNFSGFWIVENDHMRN